MLLLWCDDADQVGVHVAAALLGVQPRLSVRDVQVAVPLKLGPTLLTLLLICSSNTKESHSTLSPLSSPLPKYVWLFRLGTDPQPELHTGGSHEKRPSSTSSSQRGVWGAEITLDVVSVFLFYFHPIQRPAANGNVSCLMFHSSVQTKGTVRLNDTHDIYFFLSDIHLFDFPFLHHLWILVNQCHLTLKLTSN